MVKNGDVLTGDVLTMGRFHEGMFLRGGVLTGYPVDMGAFVRYSAKTEESQMNYSRPYISDYSVETVETA